MKGQVIESVELQRHAKHKRPGELGGKSFELWLGEWAQRWHDGERIAVLVDRDSTHAVVVRTEGPNRPDPVNKQEHSSSPAATTSAATRSSSQSS